MGSSRPGIKTSWKGNEKKSQDPEDLEMKNRHVTEITCQSRFRCRYGFRFQSIPIFFSFFGENGTIVQVTDFQIYSFFLSSLPNQSPKTFLPQTRPPTYPPLESHRKWCLRDTGSKRTNCIRAKLVGPLREWVRAGAREWEGEQENESEIEWGRAKECWERESESERDERWKIPSLCLQVFVFPQKKDKKRQNVISTVEGKKYTCRGVDKAINRGREKELL